MIEIILKYCLIQHQQEQQQQQTWADMRKEWHRSICRGATTSRGGGGAVMSRLPFVDWRRSNDVEVIIRNGGEEKEDP